MTDDAGELTFEVDAALLFELGEQLVARKSVALAELVKNAYDADATRVTVELDAVTAPDGTIVVRDDGDGMSFDVIRDYWMRVATPNKARIARTPRLGRQITGAKGVGRFATRKLARQLILTTASARADGSIEETTVTFDWDRFQAGLDLQDIPSNYQRRQADGRQTGTTLTLLGTREVWTDSEVQAVRDDLQTLTPPFSSAVVAGTGLASAFDVDLVAPEFPKLEGSLSREFLSAATARLRATVGEDGRPEYTLTFRGRPGTFRFRPAELNLPQLAGAAIEIHLFRFERDAL